MDEQAAASACHCSRVRAERQLTRRLRLLRTYNSAEMRSEPHTQRDAMGHRKPDQLTRHPEEAPKNVVFKLDQAGKSSTAFRHTAVTKTS